ncbi:hypothetical protein [Vibrio sp. ABG19]|uniref:hypothetical protein n=1 Tax=Vibrio sp. ABG19 TaxID=2817385 RepID=UPI00249DC91E|nr:hypothetical protein [Vibrio sp. ABG19]WGY46809.1 hypothetical protein J0X00_18655 [Vibrio sp. ABG19]
MIIELTGCTGSGKSTLLHKIIARHQGQSLEVISAQTLIMHKLHLSWCAHEAGQRIVMTLVGLIWCLAGLRHHRTLLLFCYGFIRHLPDEIGLKERMKIARIVARNIGLHRCIKYFDGPDYIVIVDEGTLHIAHYLFVYETLSPDLVQIERFISLVPIPDGGVFLQAAREQLITRTLARGHGRVTSGSPQAVENFITHALAVSECIRQCPDLRCKLVVVSSHDGTIRTDLSLSADGAEIYSVIKHLVNG